MWFPKNRGKVRKEKMKFYLNDGKKVDMHTEEITDNAYMYIGEINGEQVFSEWADSVSLYGLLFDI